MAETSQSGHSEAIAGVRVKRFLTLALMKFTFELISRDDSIDTKKFIETTILELMKTSFSLTSSDNPLSQAKLFLSSLGFSPCEIEWTEDVRLGKVLLGKGRLWRPSNDQETELLKLILTTIVRGIGNSFLGSNVQANFVESELLPPRFTYEIQFRGAEDVFAESIHTTTEESEVLLSAGSLLSPILGTGIRIQDATRHLVDATRSITEEFKSELLEREDIRTYPLKVLEILYLNLQDNSNQSSFALQIGKNLAKTLRHERPELPNHKMLKGIGLLPVEEIDELMFYGSVEICGTRDKGINLPFCHFLGNIWAGYASEVLGKKFQMKEDPLCASGTGTKCIFTLELE